MLLLDHCCHVAVVSAIEDHEFEILIDGKFGRLTLGIGQPVDEVEPELGGLVVARIGIGQPVDEVARPCDVLRSDDKVFLLHCLNFTCKYIPLSFPCLLKMQLYCLHYFGS